MHKSVACIKKHHQLRGALLRQFRWEGGWQGEKPNKDSPTAHHCAIEQARPPCHYLYKLEWLSISGNWSASELHFLKKQLKRWWPIWKQTVFCNKGTGTHHHTEHCRWFLTGIIWIWSRPIQKAIQSPPADSSLHTNATASRDNEFNILETKGSFHFSLTVRENVLSKKEAFGNWCLSSVYVQTNMM